MLLLCTVTWISAQQTQIDYNSSADPEEPQLLLLEVDDPGAAVNSDGWSRMWFKNSTDATNRWGFLARPHNDAVDNQNVISSPLVMAYTGVQKFGFGKDGNLVINKNFILPNTKGTQGQTLVTTDQTTGTNMTTVVDWGYPGEILDTDEDTGVSLTEAVNDAIRINVDGNAFMEFNGSSSFENITVKKFTSFEDILRAESYIKLQATNANVSADCPVGGGVGGVLRGRIYYNTANNRVMVCTNQGWKGLEYN